MFYQKLFSVLTLCIFGLSLSSCRKNESLQIQGQNYEFEQTKDSKGGMFELSIYKNNSDQLILVIPEKFPPGQDLSSFAKIYTKTFEAQGFSFKSLGDKYLGVSSTNIVYLTPAISLGASGGLGILLQSRSESLPTEIEAASAIYIELSSLVK